MFDFLQSINFFQLTDFLHNIYPFIRAVAIVVFGYVGVSFVRRSVLRACKDKLSQHMSMLLGNILFYAGMSIVGIMTLQALGFNLSTLLGAAGVVGVALGFASQTSVSNIISGLFLLFEQSFSVGDTISVGGISGIVDSIDLFSVKVKTFDNELIRIPNESLLKQQVKNVTYFDTRRAVFSCEVPTNQDIVVVKKAIEQAIADTKQILSDPQPVIIFKEVKQIPYIDAQRTVLLVRVWSTKKDIFTVKNAFVPRLKELCDSQNISAVITHAN